MEDQEYEITLYHPEYHIRRALGKVQKLFENAERTPDFEEVDFEARTMLLQQFMLQFNATGPDQSTDELIDVEEDYAHLDQISDDDAVLKYLEAASLQHAIVSFDSVKSQVVN